MPQPLYVHLLPSLVVPESLREGTAVIIDILRASSTIITALHNGATRVVPCGTPEEAVQIKESAAPGSVLLGGERGGVRIAGFDLGNSPSEYPPERVSGRTVAFTTTNGTRALLQASSAHNILIGAFLNREALLERLDLEHRPTHLICAGTDGVITGEDVLFAGAIADGLLLRAARNTVGTARWILNDSAEISRSFWRQSTAEGQPAPGNSADSGDLTQRTGKRPPLTDLIQTVLKETRGGRNLSTLGYDADILLCSQPDTVTTLPRYFENEHALRPDG